MSVLKSWGMKCPQCGEDHRIDVQAKLWVRVVTDGTDADASEDGNHEWDKDSDAVCRGCGHEGKVGRFKVEEPSEAA